MQSLGEWCLLKSERAVSTILVASAGPASSSASPLGLRELASRLASPLDFWPALVALDLTGWATNRPDAAGLKWELRVKNGPATLDAACAKKDLSISALGVSH
mmetsp:Transcript_23483/g.79623  ORF Transcript_23483/g.79623 Transcript_23483/m.79623 type:complete len:103 (-) Transcript_23483:288-596(-)